MLTERKYVKAANKVTVPKIMQKLKPGATPVNTCAHDCTVSSFCLMTDGKDCSCRQVDCVCSM